MRVYLPATVADLQAPNGLTARAGFAVTDRLRELLPDEDDEGWEFAALLAAADAAVDLCDRARIVVAADIAQTSGESRVAEVQTPPIPWSQAVSIHIDDPDDEAAHDALIAARAGDPQARERVNDADLLWYDVTERAVVTAALRRP